jgi:outer membrane protein TolC
MIDVLYFAWVRERIGLPRERLETSAPTVAALFPAGTAWISAPFADGGVWSAPAPWAAGLGLSWTFDGLAGPFLRLRQATVGVDSAEVSRDGLERDLRLGIAVAREAAAASATVAAAARAREAVAEDALQIGYARLDVGLGNPLEILRLQDEAAQARAERVTAELDAALAALEARRLAGVPW